MIRRVDLRGKHLSKAEYNRLIPRAALDVATAMHKIEPILQQVKNGRESDLLDLAVRFDGIAPHSISVPRDELTNALAGLDPKVRESLEVAIQRVRLVHQAQIRSDKTTTVEDGATVTERWIPVDRVGLYVPGGRAVYPSSVIMNVIDRKSVV